MNDTLKKILGTLITVTLLGGIIYFRAQLNSAGFNAENSNFSFFWLAGRMVLDGENPYDQTQYLAGHDTYGIEWRPNKIFPYPLPLAIFCIPLGFFSVDDAYFLWTVISLMITVITIYTLLKHWDTTAHRRLLIPIFIFMLFFGPNYLTLRTGAISALSLLTILIAILLLDKNQSMLAGIVLSLTMLKPPQGLTILLLAGIWFLGRRDWKAIGGVAIGGVGLVLIGMLQDPQWIIKFAGASEAVMDRTLGIHSNVWAYSYLACNGSSPCSTLLGITGSLVLLGLGGLYLWQIRPQGTAPVQVTAWEAFNIIIPVAFVSTIYLWSYDQLPYIIPIVWITGTLVKNSKSYIYAFLFLITLDLFSLYALLQHAEISKDLWSLGNTLIVLGMVLWLYHRRANSSVEKDIPVHA